jgi:hypothetical protein
MTTTTAASHALLGCPTWCTVDHFGDQAPEPGEHFRPLSSDGKGRTVDLGTYARSGDLELVIDFGRDALWLPADRAGLEELRDLAGMLRRAADGLSGLLHSGELEASGRE